MKKATKLNEMLKQRYDIDLLEGRVIPAHIEAVAEYYTDKRAFLKAKLDESSDLSSDAYTKAYLISEAARMILKEIKPKRTKRKGK